LGGTFTALKGDPSPFVASLPNPSCATVTPTGTTYTLQLNLATAGCYSKNANAYVSSIFSKLPPGVYGGNYFYSYSQKNDFRQDIVRVDQTINDKIRFYGRYMHDDVPENDPLSVSWNGYQNFPGIAPDTLNAPGRNVVGNLSWTISPRLTNELEYVYSWGGINITETGLLNGTAFTGSLTNNYAYKDPYNRGAGVSMNSNGLTAGPGFAPYFERNIDQSLIDNASFIAGPHALRFGFSLQVMEKTENAVSGFPAFSFSDLTSSGNVAVPALAQFLLGQDAGYSQQNKDTVPDLRYNNIELYVQDDWKVTRRLTLNLGVRYSHFPTPTDAGNTLTNFSPLLFSTSTVPVIDSNSGNMLSGQAYNAANYANGLIFPTGSTCTAAKAISPTASCSPYGSTINPGTDGNIAPRFGFAFDPFGKGKTSIRGGYGIFYDRTLNGMFEQNAFGDPPLVQTTRVPFGPFDNILSGAAGSAPLGPVGLTASGSPAWHTPYYQSFNLSVQHEILPNTKLEVAYVGGLGRHLLGEVDLNQPTVAARLAADAATTTAGTGNYENLNYLRPYAGYGRIASRNPEFTSNYNSLQISLNRRVTNGLSVGLAYTYSKALTTNTDDRSNIATYVYNLMMDYGPSRYNIPQNLSFNYIYDLPFYKGQRGFVGHALGGWEISGITTIQSGQPVTIYQFNDPFLQTNATTTSGDGGLGIGNVRADRTSTAISYPKSVSQWFNPASFTNAVGHFGTSSNGQILGPGQEVWDIGIIKNTNFTERIRLQFRAEFFNSFNHANFSGIDNYVGDSTFGAVTSTHEPRNLQLGLKLIF